MPELPEVETIRRGLQKRIVGLTLKKVDVLTPKIFQGDFKKVEGGKVINVWRRAKMLGIDLDNSQTLLFHLKMTGQLIFIGVAEKERLIGGHPTSDMKDAMPNSSTRVIFEFSGGQKLYFNDQRKFGWVKLVSSSNLKDQKEIKQLGPELLDKSFNWKILKENLLKRKKMPIKVALMDQSLVAGIGNIYASESLFLARIDPQKRVDSLVDDDFKKLYIGIKESLQTALERGGSTRSHFVNIEGERGYFLDYANVYGRNGQKCKGCPGKIVKITQAGRGTYFCPNCQK